MIPSPENVSTEQSEPVEPLRVIALHDLLYCERLFFLTEVEGIQCPNTLIYAGRRLHTERFPADDETPEMRSFEVGSEAWGLIGKVDAVRRRDGAWVAYEHKRGRCRLARTTPSRPGRVIASRPSLMRSSSRRTSANR